MKNSQIEKRIERLEEQMKAGRFISFGLLAFMIPIFLIGQVTAQNEIFNADRIVASEYVLSKDGVEYGKWYVEPERELTDEDKKIHDDARSVAPKFYPQNAILFIKSDESINKLTAGGLIIEKNEGDFLWLGTEFLMINNGMSHVNLSPGSIDLKNDAYSFKGSITMDSSGIDILAYDSSTFITSRSISIDTTDLNGPSVELGINDSSGYIRAGRYLKSNIELSSNNETSSLSVLDSKLVTRAVIGNVDIVTKKTGDITKRSASSITLFDENNDIIIKLP